ncbi:hypothetical protein RYD26_10180 [Pasteurellaceae bacterium LIM206]|nr:hypothetical protein [Pasteurellaceae bacterium LIM206]
MLNVLKKHYFCIIFSLTMIGGIIYLSLWFEDMTDIQYYPISLSKKDEISIDYKTPYIVSDGRCFMLGFAIRDSSDMAHYNKRYPIIYHNQTEAEYYFNIENKPKLHIKIFKDNTLVQEKDIYATEISSHGDNIINNKNYWIRYIDTSSGYKRGGCYYFLPNSHYKIIVTNLIPKEDYKDIEVFFIINTIKHR